MSDLNSLFAGIVADPVEETRWLVLADWVEEFDDPQRAELLRLHRKMLNTCTEPHAHPERDEWHGRMMELMRAGVPPYSLYYSFKLPGDLPLSFAFIPPGSFLMGSPDSERLRGEGELQHLVTLTKSYCIGIYPVTQAQWVSVMGANPSKFKRDVRLPVETVSWDDAVAFCGKVSELTGCAMRLPTEAEWERAARAGTTTPYYWVGEADGTQANFWGQDPGGPDPVGAYPGWTTPVRSYAAVAPHPWGLTDLLGNVLEWCSDWFDRAFYARSPVEDPECRDVGQERSTRGGSWLSVRQDARIAARGGSEPGTRGSGLGFRVAFGLS